MSTNDTFLAVFLGSKTSAKMAAWNALPEAERRAKEREGMAAWKTWVEKHQGAIVAMGGPLGKTKKVDASGIVDIGSLRRAASPRANSDATPCDIDQMCSAIIIADTRSGSSFTSGGAVS